MTSDHYHVMFDLNLSHSNVSGPTISEEKLKFNLAKADWPLFHDKLYEKCSNYSNGFLDSLNVFELNNLVKQDILDACNHSTPKLNPHPGKTFPKELLSLIFKRKNLKKN